MKQPHTSLTKRKKKQPRYTIKKMVDAITASNGLLSAAARSLGCSRATVHNYINRYPAVAEAVKATREHVIDVAENALYRAAARGESWAVCFLLKTQAKRRGYIERQFHEVTGSDGGPIVIAPKGWEDGKSDD